MNSRLTQARNNEHGFTLVELLVVIAIIAILTAIAVPAFLSQRQKANDAAVRSDMKSVVTQIETGLVDTPGDITVTTTGKVATVKIGTTAGGTSPVNLSEGVTVTGEGTVNAYELEGYHSNGKSFTSGNPLEYDSSAGGFQRN